MTERRRFKRHRRRLSVRFGEDDLSKVGFTYDISTGGLFILSDRKVTLGKRIHLQLFLTHDDYLLMEGVAVREKAVPAELRAVVKSGVGVRLLTHDDLLGALAPPEPAGEAAPVAPPPAVAADGRFSIEYRSIDELQRAYRAEIKHGGVFVGTEASLPVGAPVTLEIRFGFSDRRIELDARVLQVVTAGARGLALAFNDQDEVMKQLRAYVPLF